MIRAIADKLAELRGPHGSSLLMSFPVVLTICAAYSVAADTYNVTIEHDLELKTRDGVTLRADVCRPKAEGKFPVLLTRTPYNKEGSIDFCLKAQSAVMSSSYRTSAVDLPPMATGIRSSTNRRT